MALIHCIVGLVLANAMCFVVEAGWGDGAQTYRSQQDAQGNSWGPQPWQAPPDPRYAQYPSYGTPPPPAPQDDESVWNKFGRNKVSTAATGVGAILAADLIRKGVQGEDMMGTLGDNKMEVAAAATLLGAGSISLMKNWSTPTATEEHHREREREKESSGDSFLQRVAANKKTAAFGIGLASKFVANRIPTGDDQNPILNFMGKHSTITGASTAAATYGFLNHIQAEPKKEEKKNGWWGK